MPIVSSTYRLHMHYAHELFSAPCRYTTCQHCLEPMGIVHYWFWGRASLMAHATHCGCAHSVRQYVLCPPVHPVSASTSCVRHFIT